MTKFKFSSLLPEDKQKKKETHPAPSPTKTPRTVQRTPRKSTTTITKNDLQSFKDDLLSSLKSIQTENIQLRQENLQLKQRPSVEFNELIALEYVINRDRKGYKPSMMFDAFRLDPKIKTKKDIESMDQYFIQNKFVKVHDNGWRKYTSKGLQRYETLSQSEN